MIFFSSRKRHTRSKRDWSSDVCSSDLEKTNNIKVKEIMNDQPLTISPGKTVSDALTIMHEKRVDTLFVVDDYNKLLGRVTIEFIANVEDQSKNKIGRAHV